MHFVCYLFFSTAFGFNFIPSSQVVVYPTSVTDTISQDYKVKVDNDEVPVFYTRVSAIPINIWPGINRPLAQTELASFSYFNISDEATINIDSKEYIRDVIIRPLSLKINPVIRGNTITFKISKPCQMVVEVNGINHALHLFANPVETNAIVKSSKNILYFGPGDHYPGVIHVKDNQTIYLAEGAVVYGAIYGYHVKNVKIMGRGILDASNFRRGFDSISIMQFEHSHNLLIDGIILRNSHIWTLFLHESDNVVINNIKIIGMWRYNADGIDIVNSKNIIVKNSFIRAFDDCIALKGIRTNYWAKEDPLWDSLSQSNIKNISVTNCVIWNDWGFALEIGEETITDSISHVKFKDCDIIHYVFGAMNIQNGNRAVVCDITFENIRVEDPITENVYLDDLNNPVTDISRITDSGRKIYKYKEKNIGHLIDINVKDNGWQKDKSLGSVSDILFKNINYLSIHTPVYSTFEGYSNNHKISHIRLINLIINNHYIQSGMDANFQQNKFVEKICFGKEGEGFCDGETPGE